MMPEEDRRILHDRRHVRTVRKAVFPAAGLGTRFLPATKAQPKEMLPLVDKPIIQYGVEEAMAAGSLVCNASAPSRSNRSTIFLFSSASLIGWLQPSHMNTAIGTPQMRCRLMHQSGRIAIMLVIRSLPHAGSHTTLSISSIICQLPEHHIRSVLPLNIPVQRNEPLLGRAKDHRIVAAPAVRIAMLQVAGGHQAPRSCSKATITGLAFHTVSPS